MTGILIKIMDTWGIKWSDLHSFTHGTHWEITELSPDTSLVEVIKYIKDNDSYYDSYNDGWVVDFEHIMDTDSYNLIRYAKLIPPTSKKNENLIEMDNKNQIDTHTELVKKRLLDDIKKSLSNNLSDMVKSPTYPIRHENKFGVFLIHEDGTLYWMPKQSLEYVNVNINITPTDVVHLKNNENGE